MTKKPKRPIIIIPGLPKDYPKYSTAPHKTPNFSMKRRKGEIWCPYCGEWKRYKQNVYGYYACPSCTISTADFWVRTANCLWDSYKPKDAKLNVVKERLEGKQNDGK